MIRITRDRANGTLIVRQVMPVTGTARLVEGGTIHDLDWARDIFTVLPDGGGAITLEGFPADTEITEFDP
jgi:hypothetical protein